MSDRIWELFRQANHPHPKYGGNDMFFPEEFAELIVRECAKVAGDFEYARLHDSLVEDKILQHFGVE